MNSVQLTLDLGWGSVPWSGQAPRTLTKGFLRDVEKSRTLAKPATVDDFYPDPAQYNMWVYPLLQEEV